MTIFSTPAGVSRYQFRSARRLGFGTTVGTVLVGVVLIGAVLARAGPVAAQAHPTVRDVQAGDTFSGIASRFTGSPATWRKLYRTDLSNLADPNRIAIGMRFEMVAKPKGGKYLRLLAPAQAVARAAPVLSRPPATGAPAEPTRPVAALSPVVSSAATGNNLVIEVLPKIAASVLSANYARMKRYLERGNEHTVTIVIPSNFKEFFDSTMRGDFDVAIAAPHFARVAQLDRNMVPLLTYQPQINGLFIAASDTDLKEPRDVRERVVAFANPQSLVAMYGRQWLERGGLKQGSDYEMRGARTDLGVGRMLLTGDAVAGIMSNSEFRALPSDEVSRLKVVEIFAKIPNFILMAHPRIERVRLAKLKDQSSRLNCKASWPILKTACRLHRRRDLPPLPRSTRPRCATSTALSTSRSARWALPRRARCNACGATHETPSRWSLTRR